MKDEYQIMFFYPLHLGNSTKHCMLLNSRTCSNEYFSRVTCKRMCFPTVRFFSYRVLEFLVPWK